MPDASLKMELLDGTYGICSLDRSSPIPPWSQNSGFFSITVTPDELSIVTDEDSIPSDVQCDRAWRILRLVGPLDFALTGVLAKLSSILAEKHISIFAISTYNTDYILVKESNIQQAIDGLTEHCYAIAMGTAKL